MNDICEKCKTEIIMGTLMISTGSGLMHGECWDSIRDDFFKKHNQGKIRIGNIGNGSSFSIEELYQAFKERLWKEFEENEVVELDDIYDKDGKK